MPSQVRRRHFVHKGIQRALVLRMVLHIVAFAASSFTVTVFLEIVRDPFRDPGQWRQMMTTAVIAFSATTICLLPILIWDSIKFSNRFVGPVLRLQSELRKVGQQAVSTMRLRNTDYWHELADDFNLMLQRLPHIEQEPSAPAATIETRPVSGSTASVSERPTSEVVPPVTAV